jgi:hypothetical protein
MRWQGANRTAAPLKALALNSSRPRAARARAYCSESKLVRSKCEMADGQLIKGPKGDSYKFKHEGKFYEVIERFGPLKSVYSVSVSFRRVTNNVYGNGSKNVEQSVSRELPRNGPRWRSILNIYLSRKKHGQF